MKLLISWRSAPNSQDRADTTKKRRGDIESKVRGHSEREHTEGAGRQTRRTSKDTKQVGRVDGHSRELSQCRHEDGFLGVLSGETLEEHHETAVSGETRDSLLFVKIIDGFKEFLLDFLGHLA